MNKQALEIIAELVKELQGAQERITALEDCLRSAKSESDFWYKKSKEAEQERENLIEKIEQLKYRIEGYTIKEGLKNGDAVRN